MSLRVIIEVDDFGIQHSISRENHDYHGHTAATVDRLIAEVRSSFLGSINAVPVPITEFIPEVPA